MKNAHILAIAVVFLSFVAISSIAYAAKIQNGVPFAAAVREFLGFENEPDPITEQASHSQVETNTRAEANRIDLLASDQFFACDGTGLATLKWAPSSAGPFTDSFVANNNANFWKANGTGTGGSITVSGLVATENFTITSASGTISNAGNSVIPITVASGKLLDFGTQGFTTSATAGYTKEGAGALAIAGSTYGGGFTLNSGTVIVRGVNAMGGGATNTLTINGGAIGANANRVLTNKYPGGITVGGDFQMGVPSTAVSLAVNNAALTFTNNISLGAGTRKITIGADAIYVLSGVISGAPGSGLTIAGLPPAIGSIELDGINTYTGPTTISGGVLALNGPASIANSSQIEIAGGASFDVQSLLTPLTLTGGQILKASGTSSTGIILTGSIIKGLTTVPTSPVIFSAFNGATPPLTISGTAPLVLTPTTPVTVTVSNGLIPLAPGNYKLIAKINAGATGGVSGTSSSLTINGDGVAGTASLVNTAGELFLHVVAAANGAVDFDHATYSQDEFGGTASITLQRTGGSSGAVSVQAAFTNTTATGGATCTAGVDYVNVGSPFTVNFADGQTTASFNVPICNDTLWEPGGPESVALSLSNPTGGATIGSQSTAVLNIIDDDLQPVVQLTGTTFSIGENSGVATITLQRNNASGNQVSVNYNTSAGTATGGPCGAFSGNDFQIVSGTVTFLAGETSESFEVPICNDNLFENQEDFLVALNTPITASLGTPNQATVLIDEEDIAPTIQFSTSAATAGENAGTITLTVNRSGASENSFAVNFQTADGTAVNGPCNTGDYNSNSGTLNFAGGDPSKSFNVTICDDSAAESDETFSASLTAPSGPAVIGAISSETLTITDNDSPPVIDVAPPSVAYGNQAVGITSAPTTIMVSNTGTIDLHIASITANGANPGDYSITNSPAGATIAPGNNVQFQVTFTPGATGSRPATIAITSDDPSTPTFDVGLSGTGVNADYTVSTASGSITVTDVAGNSDPLGMNEPAGGQVTFTALGRTFVIDGTTSVTGSSGILSLSGINSITLNQGGGDDLISISSFSAQMADLTINGGTGNDVVQFNGTLNFASGASLNADLQDDDPTPGNDSVQFTDLAQLHFSGTGAATLKVSQSVTSIPGGSIQIENGDLTIEANQQAVPAAGGFPGVFLNGMSLTTIGSGKIGIKGNGGSLAGTGAHSGVVIVGGTTISSTFADSSAGTVTLDGTGGQGTTANNGVDLEDAGTAVSSVSGDISITGHGGPGTVDRNYGVAIQTGAAVNSTGTAKVTINGTGGSGTRALTGVRIVGPNSNVTSAGGDVSVTGQGGTGTVDSNFGVLLIGNGSIAAANGAKVTIDGTAGTGAFGLWGVDISASNITSDSGDISVTGHAGDGTGMGANIGINVDSGAMVSGTGSANVTLNGTGGAGTDDCYGIGFDSGATPGTSVSSQDGNILIIGAAGTSSGPDMDGIRFEDSAGAEAVSVTVTGVGQATLYGTAGNTDATSSGINVVDDTNITAAGQFTALIADTMDIGTSNVSINVGANTMTLVGQTPGRQITLGGNDTATELGLTDSELDTITAGNLFIGDTNSGPVITLADITRSASTNLNVVSGANIDLNSGLLNSGGGNVNLSPGTHFTPFKSGTDIRAGSGTVKISSGRVLQLFFLGTTPDSGYTQLNVEGVVDLNNSFLGLSGNPLVVAPGQTYLIVNNDGSDPVTGTFGGLPQGAAIPNFLGSGLNAVISYAGGDGNDVTITIASSTTISVSNVSHSEGNSGTTAYTFNVTISALPATSASVQFDTTDGTATAADNDYQPSSGTVTWTPVSPLTQQVTVLVNGDTNYEQDESFTLHLSDPVNVTIASEGTGTITNDDSPPLSLIVNTSDDLDFGACSLSPGHCSLREAINAANALPDANTITFAPTVTGSITLGNTLPLIGQGVSISGPGAAVLSIDGANAVQILTNIATPQPVNISGLTFTHGTVSGEMGAAIQNFGAMTISSCVFSANTATGGGAVAASSPLTTTISDSTFTGNDGLTGSGGALNYLGKVVIVRSTFDHNSAGTGGAISGSGDLTIANSTVSTNTASFVGGVDLNGGTATFVNATITANHAASGASAGGIRNNPGATTISIRNTIIAGNSNIAGPLTPVQDVDGPFVSLGHNLIGQGSGGTGFGGPGDQVGSPLISANLGPLANNGGTTRTHALVTPSSAINAGDDCVVTVCTPDYGFSITTDQRGVGRMIGGHVDIGAYEILVPTAAPATLTGRVLLANGSGLRSAVITVTGGDLKAPIVVTTGTFGFFAVPGLTAGQAYAVTVSSRLHTFTPSTRFVQVFDDVAGFDFVADP